MAFDISKKQFRVGRWSATSPCWTAQRLFLEARQSRVQAPGSPLFRLRGIVSRALGGGWWNQKDQEVASK